MTSREKSEKSARFKASKMGWEWIKVWEFGWKPEFRQVPENLHPFIIEEYSKGQVGQQGLPFKGALDNILKFHFWLNFIYHVKCNC